MLDSDGFLTISGSGCMENYGLPFDIPWFSNITIIPESANVLNAKVKSITLPLKGAKTSTKKIYVKPLSCTLSNQLSIPPEAEILEVSEVKDLLKINTDEIILKTPFAEYCKSKWGQGSVVVYAPDSQGAIVKIV